MVGLTLCVRPYFAINSRSEAISNPAQKTSNSVVPLSRILDSKSLKTGAAEGQLPLAPPHVTFRTRADRGGLVAKYQTLYPFIITDDFLPVEIAAGPIPWRY
jgi:hypothetical protein